MNRLLATILQWECEVVHVPGKKIAIPVEVSTARRVGAAKRR